MAGSGLDSVDLFVDALIAPFDQGALPEGKGMTVRSLLKRAGVVTAASTALVLAGATSASGLAAARTLLSNPEQHAILPDVISKEPLGPVVRQDDPVWTDIVRWTVYAVILGEELGLEEKLRARLEKEEVNIMRGILTAWDHKNQRKNS